MSSTSDTTLATVLRKKVRITREDMLAAANLYDVDPADAIAAYDNMSENGTKMVVVSGRLGAGKDSFAPKILQMLGVSDVQQHSFAKELKDEMDAIFATIRYWARIAGIEPSSSITEVERRSLAGVISVSHNIPVEQALAYFSRDVADAVITDPDLHSRVRTDAVRSGLQRLGTDVRRAQDDLYWVKRTIRPMIEALAAGNDVVLTSVVSTDGRFPNELDAVRAFGGIAVRLDITDETQDKRVWARDGLKVSDAARFHKSETAVDDYPNFDVRVSNDGSEEETLAAIKQGLVDIGLL